MDFKAQEISFEEADHRYEELQHQLADGSISEEEFEAQRQRLMLLDGEGRWWAKSRGSGEWRYHDGSAWVAGTPPGYGDGGGETTAAASAGPASGAASGGARTTAAPAARGGTTTTTRRRRGVPLWVPILGIGGLLLLAIVVVGWVLVPSVQPAVRGLVGSLGGGGEGQEEAPPPEENEPAPQQEEAAGIAFEASFVHTATGDTISANSTYIDNPATNGNPDAVLHVTQNWNPGAGDGTYNDHEIGVWYDSEVELWAIFNQDIEPMTEGADFNVGVMKDTSQE